MFMLGISDWPNLGHMLCSKGKNGWDKELPSFYNGMVELIIWEIATVWKSSSKHMGQMFIRIIIMIPLCPEVFSGRNSYLFSEINVCYVSVFLLTCQFGNSFIMLHASVLSQNPVFLTSFLLEVIFEICLLKSDIITLSPKILNSQLISLIYIITRNRTDQFFTVFL